MADDAIDHSRGGHQPVHSGLAQCIFKSQHTPVRPTDCRMPAGADAVELGGGVLGVPVGVEHHSGRAPAAQI
jgi:hypothetical protein